MNLFLKILILSFLPITFVMSATQIPEFTPNVVDQFNYISKQDSHEINQKIDELKGFDIWAAVYITNKLDNESIEELAERTFKKWQLGLKGKDNGLLLLLVMEDRQSRFEVGYGLEGDLTDLKTHHALTKVLAPEMREGNIKLAIINSLDFLKEYKSKDLSSELLTSNETALYKRFSTLGYLGLIYYLFFLWFFSTIINYLIKLKLKKLSALYPGDHFVFLNKNIQDKSKGKFQFINIFIKAFMSINPGFFVLVLCHLTIIGLLSILIICPLIVFLYARTSLKIYSSKESYLKYLDNIRERYKDKISKGYVVETSTGSFSYTDSWYTSEDFKIASTRRSGGSGSGGFSSSGSSSRSSSSGGGRSGGGGSSSRW